VNAPRLTCMNHPAGYPSPLQRARPESVETGTSSPEKLMQGVTVRTAAAKIAATCVEVKVEMRRPNPVDA
jgi:hypothetical protein